MFDIVNYILSVVLGPANYYRGVAYMKVLYDAPSLSLLIETISTAERLGVSVIIDTDVIQKGMEELKNILDLMVDEYQNLTDEQKLACKSGNTWFVESCYSEIMSRVRAISS